MELKVREIVEALSGQAEPFDPWRTDDNDQAKDRLVSSIDCLTRESGQRLAQRPWVQVPTPRKGNDGQVR